MTYILTISLYASLFVGAVVRMGMAFGDSAPLPPTVGGSTILASATGADKANDGLQGFGVQPNQLTEGEHLQPFFDELRKGEKCLRILQIGDSHVAGNYLPQALGRTLRQAWGGETLEGVDADTSPSLDGGIVFDYIGINGAHAVRFSNPDMLERIAAFAPDLVVISFGTNEAHGHFDEATHTAQLQALVDGIRASCPEVSFLLTTPPGSYIRTRSGRRWRDRRGRWHTNTVHTPNATTDRVAANIVRFGHEQHIAVWDIFGIAGGKERACRNWLTHGYMQADQIHYTAQGYELQGTMLGQAIVEAEKKGGAPSSL